MEARVQTWSCNAGSTRGRRFYSANRCLAAHRRRDVRYWRVLLLANWPWTIFGIMPTNRVLMATELEAASSQSRALIVKWNRLHSVRTVLGCLAILAFLIAL